VGRGGADQEEIDWLADLADEVEAIAEAVPVKGGE